MRRYLMVAFVAALASLLWYRGLWLYQSNKFLHWFVSPTAEGRISHYKIQLAEFNSHGRTKAEPIALESRFLPSGGVVFNRWRSFGYAILRTPEGPQNIVRINADGKVSMVVALPEDEVNSQLRARGMKYQMKDVRNEINALAVDWRNSRLFIAFCAGSGQPFWLTLDLEGLRWHVKERWDQRYCPSVITYKAEEDRLLGLGTMSDPKFGDARAVLDLSTTGVLLAARPSNLDPLLRARQNRPVRPRRREQRHERYADLGGRLMLNYDEIEFSYADPTYYILTRLTVELDWDSGLAVTVQ